jgi:hypothetical protein
MGYLIDIGAVILVIAILSLAASSVPSKRALIITIGCFAAVIGGILWYLGSTYLQRQQEQRNLASVIAKDQIALKDMKLTGDEIFKLTGRVENHNPEATVARITLEIEVRDCAQRDPAGTCGSVGDLKFPLYVTIPPGEARAVAAYGRLPSRRHIRELDWSYRIGEVVAAEEPF